MNHQRDLVIVAVTPSMHDIAIASEVILATVESGVLSTSLFFEPVARRLASEPSPDVSRTIEGVTEADIRRVRSAAATMTALAHLQARGGLIPLGNQSFAPTDTVVAYLTEHSQGGYNVDQVMNFGVVAAYALPSYELRSKLIDSPAVFLENLPPSLGPKVARVLHEAIDAYRFGLYFSTAVLLGVSSDAAWGQLARAALVAFRDLRPLQALVEDEYASAAGLQRRVTEALRPKKLIRDGDWTAIEVTAQSLRDLRNYAVHRPDDAFEETRVARPVVGVLLEASVDYFQRIYQVVDKLKAMEPQGA